MDTTTATRRSLHAVAEQVLAGPQHRASGTIRLQVTGDGFATVAAPTLTVTSTALVADDLEITLDGATIASLAGALGVRCGAPAGLYTDHPDVSADEPLRVDAAVARDLLAALRRGDAALRRLAPDVPPVLWPEHFDVAVTLDQTNFGVSLGDGHLALPYAYVGPWTPRTAPFWNAPFGAARALGELPGAALDDFFAEGRRLASA
jgi:hypothetical protein